MTETYVSSLRCSNCGWYGEMKIPKGTTVGNFVRGAKCPICGCETIARG